ncbi:MAG: Lrp/AsnC family transcriptional regulator [Nanoarchaeota archaeon]|nr:Lrp/AsnC family transcriptional regulator [Nanoarchaeota archaeon]
MKTRDLKILQELRKNSRQSITNIGNLAGVPLSSTFKRMGHLEKHFIKKYVSIVDFSLLGFSVRISLVLKSKTRDELKNFLIGHPNVNSLHRINQDFDFFVETIFPNMLAFENFIDELNSLVSDKKVFHVIKDLRTEDFVFVENEQPR